jgi:hypothetical protein
MPDGLVQSKLAAVIVNAELALAMGVEGEARERIARALGAAWEASRLARELAVPRPAQLLGPAAPVLGLARQERQRERQRLHRDPSPALSRSPVRAIRRAGQPDHSQTAPQRTVKRGSVVIRWWADRVV